MEIIYSDPSVLVCVKPAGVVSTDSPGGVPELAREALGDESADVRTVHRLDQVVSGLMVLARNAAAASELSRQIREGEFEKEYLAVVHGTPDPLSGRFIDLLCRDKRERKTYIVQTPAKDVQEAILDYQVLAQQDGMSKAAIQLVTGRTHQIRAQFSGRGFPLVGDRKYSTLDDGCNIALWSHKIGFLHPSTGEKMVFVLEPPRIFPWDVFGGENDEQL